jgi:hypothetical protein
MSVVSFFTIPKRVSQYALLCGMRTTCLANLHNVGYKLSRGKEGHAATSVYSDVHGIRNTLCGLLTTKINVFKKTECHEWNPSNDLKRALGFHNKN